MNLLLLTIVIALGWCAATASFSLGNLLFGALLATVALYFARGSQVFQAVVYADRLDPEVLQVFFAGLKF